MTLKNDKSDTGAIILAAGKSSRMGKSKLLLKGHSDKLIIEEIVETYRGWGCREIIVVINTADINARPKGLPVTFVVNSKENLGRLYSLRLGLCELRNLGYCFVQNADNPFLDHFLLNRLYAARGSHDYIKPVYNDQGGHPVLINAGTMKLLATMTFFDQTLSQVLGALDTGKVEVPYPEILENLNTLESYEQYLTERNHA